MEGEGRGGRRKEREGGMRERGGEGEWEGGRDGRRGGVGREGWKEREGRWEGQCEGEEKDVNKCESMNSDVVSAAFIRKDKWRDKLMVTTRKAFRQGRNFLA